MRIELLSMYHSLGTKDLTELGKLYEEITGSPFIDEENEFTFIEWVYTFLIRDGLALENLDEQFELYCKEKGKTIYIDSDTLTLYFKTFKLEPVSVYATLSLLQPSRILPCSTNDTSYRRIQHGGGVQRGGSKIDDELAGLELPGTLYVLTKLRAHGFDIGDKQNWLDQLEAHKSAAPQVFNLTRQRTTELDKIVANIVSEPVAPNDVEDEHGVDPTMMVESKAYNDMLEMNSAIDRAIEEVRKPEKDSSQSKKRPREVQPVEPRGPSLRIPFLEALRETTKIAKQQEEEDKERERMEKKERIRLEQEKRQHAPQLSATFTQDTGDVFSARSSQPGRSRARRRRRRRTTMQQTLYGEYIRSREDHKGLRPISKTIAILSDLMIFVGLNERQSKFLWDWLKLYSKLSYLKDIGFGERGNLSSTKLAEKNIAEMRRLSAYYRRIGENFMADIYDEVAELLCKPDRGSWAAGHGWSATIQGIIMKLYERMLAQKRQIYGDMDLDWDVVEQLILGIIEVNLTWISSIENLKTDSMMFEVGDRERSEDLAMRATLSFMFAVGLFTRLTTPVLSEHTIEEHRMDAHMKMATDIMYDCFVAQMGSEAFYIATAAFDAKMKDELCLRGSVEAVIEKAALCTMPRAETKAIIASRIIGLAHKFPEMLYRFEEPGKSFKHYVCSEATAEELREEEFEVDQDKIREVKAKIELAMRKTIEVLTTHGLTESTTYFCATNFSRSIEAFLSNSGHAIIRANSTRCQVGIPIFLLKQCSFEAGEIEALLFKKQLLEGSIQVQFPPSNWTDIDTVCTRWSSNRTHKYFQLKLTDLKEVSGLQLQLPRRRRVVKLLKPDPAKPLEGISFEISNALESELDTITGKLTKFFNWSLPPEIIYIMSTSRKRGFPITIDALNRIFQILQENLKPGIPPDYNSAIQTVDALLHASHFSLIASPVTDDEEFGFSQDEVRLQPGSGEEEEGDLQPGVGEGHGRVSINSNESMGGYEDLSDDAGRFSDSNESAISVGGGNAIKIRRGGGNQLEFTHVFSRITIDDIYFNNIIMLGKISEYQDPEIYSYIDAPEEVELTSQEEASAEVARSTVESPAQGELPAEVASQTVKPPDSVLEQRTTSQNPPDSFLEQRTTSQMPPGSPRNVHDFPQGEVAVRHGGASRRYRVLLNKKKKTRQHRKYNKRTRRN